LKRSESVMDGLQQASLIATPTCKLDTQRGAGRAGLPLSHQAVPVNAALALAAFFHNRAASSAGASSSQT
jgi:hypothetical protein